MATLFFSLYFIILVVIYMFQSKIPDKVVEFVVFKLPFKVAKYFVIIVIINIILSSIGPSESTGSYSSYTRNQPQVNNTIMKQRTWDEIIRH